MSEPPENTPGERSGNLTLKKRPSQQKSSKPPPPRKPSAASRKKKKKERTSFRLLSLKLSLGSFIIGVIILGTFLAHQTQGWDIVTQEQALLIRNIGLISFLIVLILEAFTEDLLQGILCLFILPYSFIYGLFFADAGPIRGLTIAFLVFLGAEMYFTPDDAFVPKAQQVINEWIKTGQDKLIYPDGRPEAGFE